ncbi:cytochrome c biogenesis protein [Flavobacterium aurantiibacter]|nr:cytochrome c biogenesis protein CcsA [Flavobacterium aurantiibacter]
MAKSLSQRLLDILFSTRLMAVLFISYAVAMGIGTFVESGYNTETARIWIYNAWWFELIHLLFLVNFFGNIKRYQLYKREKWVTLSLHLSFILIIIGAAVTRYISYEGVMPIREGAASNEILSDRTYLTAFVDGEFQGEFKRKTIEEPLLLSMVTDNDFSISDDFKGKPFEITYVNYIMNAKSTMKPDPNGVLYLKLVEAGNGERHEHYLKEGSVQNIHNLLFAFNKETAGAINISGDANGLKIATPFDGTFMRMADQMQGKVLPNTTADLMLRSLYNVGGSQFVFPEPAIKGVETYESNNDWEDKNTDDALIVNVTANGKTETVTLVGGKGKQGEPKSFKLGDLDFTLFYGSKVYQLPFKIQLNDFIAEKYAGTEKSYSSFESKVTVIDGAKKFDERIYMNHILDYGGYRFFQASFDPDEKGTVLSVNHDFIGTWITYIGYFILYLALMLILFTKNTRFADLKMKLEKIKAKKAALTVLLLLASVSGFSQHEHQQTLSLQQIDSILAKNIPPVAHAERFGRLIIQDEGGRMKPINTFSSELLRKVSKSDHYKGYNSDQVFLSMTQYPRLWFEVPFIYIKRGNDSIRKIIGVEPGEKLVSFRRFFDKEGNYKLAPYLDAAYKAAIPNQFQKDFIETDRKVNLLNSALSGGILRIFPFPKDKNNKWVSFLEVHQPTGTSLDTIKSIMPLYMTSLAKGAETGNYTYANTLVNGMENYQKKFGASVRPSDDKIDAEIAYNKYDIFKNLFWMYMLTGVLMLLFAIVNILANKKWINYVINAFHILAALLFVLHTVGLIARWYISGHAPWSNSYESVIYVGWATMFFTLAFDRKSKLTVASGTFVASMILMIAHWSWTDPAIGNLVPVLNSYWLMIHVAVIVASYGPFTLGMILGLVTLILMICTTAKNKVKMNLHIKELTYINEMALTIGLVMLTIGNFLGGQWANESWGRYWGWDPKETWALISIMVYAFVIHARFVPALRGVWIYNLMSVLAFYSIMMTYFGVNFYLTGLHSYASGDKVVTPVEAYYSFAAIMILAGFAWFKYRKFYKVSASK